MNTLIQQVENCISSIFSKEDVIKLLKQSEASQQEKSNSKALEEKKYSLNHLTAIKNAILDQVRNMSESQICDEDDIELEMYDKRISLEINVHIDAITEEIEDAFENVLVTIEEELENVNEEVE